MHWLTLITADSESFLNLFVQISSNAYLKKTDSIKLSVKVLGTVFTDNYFESVFVLHF
jgi:hypothetical protein